MNNSIKGFLVMTSMLIPAIVFFGQESATQNLQTIQLSPTDEVPDFFRYSGADIPLISGHRGGREPGYPENSIEAFENVLKSTPAFFEIDPRVTKDSVIVLMHDATLERTTDGRGKLIDLTWDEA